MANLETEATAQVAAVAARDDLIATLRASLGVKDEIIVATRELVKLTVEQNASFAKSLEACGARVGKLEAKKGGKLTSAVVGAAVGAILTVVALGRSNQ